MRAVHKEVRLRINICTFFEEKETNRVLASKKEMIMGHLYLKRTTLPQFELDE